MLLPRRLSGSEAHELGLVDSATTSGCALDAALADAHIMASGLPLALAGIKAMFTMWPRDPREVLDREVELQAKLFD